MAMKFKRAVTSLFAGAIATICAATGVEAQHQDHTTQTQNTSNITAAAGQATLNLEDLERMALANNPTLAQAEAAIRAAEGRRKQAGLWPNPIIGYEADGLAFNDVVRQFRNAHYIFFEQNIVTFGKLGKNKNIAAREKDQTEAEAEAQRLRVLNTVRMVYYEVLG